MYTRIYPLLIIQGMFFGLAESKACKWVGLLLPVLDAALGQSHLRPTRARGRSLEEIIEEFPEIVLYVAQPGESDSDRTATGTIHTDLGIFIPFPPCRHPAVPSRIDHNSGARLSIFPWAST